MCTGLIKTLFYFTWDMMSSQRIKVTILNRIFHIFAMTRIIWMILNWLSHLGLLLVYNLLKIWDNASRFRYYNTLHCSENQHCISDAGNQRKWFAYTQHWNPSGSTPEIVKYSLWLYERVVQSFMLLSMAIFDTRHLHYL